MTEFEKWRLARQEADQLLQQLKDSDAAAGNHPGQRPGDLGRAGPAAAMRAAALRLLRPRPRPR
jgi:hypothetical protein